MNSDNRIPLWAAISQQDKLSNTSADDIAQIILIIAEQLEDYYGPTIQTWFLRNEAQHALRVKRDLMRHSINQH